MTTLADMATLAVCCPRTESRASYTGGNLTAGVKHDPEPEKTHKRPEQALPGKKKKKKYRNFTNED